MNSLRIWLVFACVLVCETAFELYAEERKPINYELVTFDPIPFADVEYLTPQYYVYYIMHHLIICAIIFLFWSCYQSNIVLSFLFLKIFDMADFFLTYNTPYFFIDNLFTLKDIPVTFNVVSSLIWSVVGLVEWRRTIWDKYLN